MKYCFHCENEIVFDTEARAWVHLQDYDAECPAMPGEPARYAEPGGMEY